VASSTALIVPIQISGTAAQGARTVTVTDGDQVAEYTNGFELIRPLVVSAAPTVPQLGVSVFSVTNQDPGFLLPRTPDAWTAMGDPGIQVTLSSVEGNTAHFLVSVDLMVPSGTHDVVLQATNELGTVRAITFPITVTDGQILDADPMQTTGTLENVYSSVAYKLVLPSDGTFILGSAWTDESLTSTPRFVVVDSSGSFANTVATSEAPGFVGVTGAELYVVVYTDRDNGDFTLHFGELDESDTEPNDTIDTAQWVVLPFTTSNGMLTLGEDEVDVYKFSVSPHDVGKRLFVQDDWTGYADYTVQVLGPTGVSFYGQSGNLYEGNSFTSQPLSEPGVYHLVVSTLTSYDGTYGFTAELQ
ncbi:MAG: hypothetical protein IRZ16_23835, partial [Myxococcaceae bacterium]|nr:hypothetical protein [Myxococcaceae bacterium]